MFVMSPNGNLWCFLQGEPKPYEIEDIPIDLNVYGLKKMIKQKIDSEYLRNIKPNDVKLLFP